jgi:hypothetical protein
VNSILGVPKKDAPDKPRMCVNLTGSKVNEKLEFIKFLYPSFDDCTDLLYPGAWLAKVDLTDVFFSIGWCTKLAASILVSRFRPQASSGATRCYPLASVCEPPLLLRSGVRGASHSAHPSAVQGCTGHQPPHLARLRSIETSGLSGRHWWRCDVGI